MKVSTALASLTLGLATVVGPAGAQEETITLRVADSFPVGHFIPEFLTKPWMERVTQATDGKVQFEYYPAQQLGKAKDMLSLAQTGVTDIAYVAPAHVTDKMPLSGVVELPGQFTSSCQGMEAYLGMMEDGPFTEREFTPNAVKPLLVLVNPPYQILTKQPIEGLDSFKGLKLRSGGGAMDVMAEKLGAVPVRMPGPDVYESLSRGTLDGIVFPLPNVMEYDLQEHVKYSTSGENFGSFVHNYVISDRKWNELPENVRETMNDIGKEVTREACGKIDDGVKPAIETLKSAGVTMVELPAEDKERLATLLDDVGKEWAAALGSRKDVAVETLQSFSDTFGAVTTPSIGEAAQGRPPSGGGRRHAILRLASETVAWLERSLIMLSSLIMMAIMFIIVVDVMCRYFLNAPLAWAFDLISLYLMGALFFFALSDTLRYNRHVSVDLFRPLMAPRVRSGCDLAISLVSLAFFLIILGEGAASAWKAFVGGNRLVGVVAWPTWIYHAFVPIGVAVISLRLALRVAGHAVALVSGEGDAEDAVASSEGRTHEGKGAQA